jgi:hypothetical protein
MRSKVESTIAGLKDFQRETVDYAIEQFRLGQTRFLIADEVGLGKTIVAKGIVARLFEESVLDGDQDRFNVVYVCSNQAIAKANIGKLNFTHDNAAISVSSEDDRITSLAYADSIDGAPRSFSIRAFTPATSFDAKTHAGRKDERVLLYRLLKDYAEIQPDKNSLKWILKGNNQISDKSWEAAILEADRGLGRPIRSGVSAELRKKLAEPMSPETLPKCFRAAGITYEVKYWTLLKNLCQLGVRKNTTGQFDFGKELISHLRLTLSQACIRFLKADIFILDEFQRYKKLLNDDATDATPAVELARAIFGMQGTKVLMLSATPFKAYTTDYDESKGEVHHEEFDAVLKFLKPEIAADDVQWQAFNRKRSGIFSILRHSADDPEERKRAVKIKGELEQFYRSCMVRTERLSVSKDKDSLIESVATEYLEPQTRDIDDFVALDGLTLYLNQRHKTQLPIPIEYVKSSPFALSFLEGYQHRKRLIGVIAEDSDLQIKLRKLSHAWVDLKQIAKYHVLSKPMPNAKLRLLLNKTIENGAWKLLWVPPSMPYYDSKGPFADLPTFSKVLVFSSWLLVPRMIATLVSYEAERLSVGNPHSKSDREQEEKRNYFDKKRHPAPQITYKVDKDDGTESLAQPANIIYLYPSSFLAKAYDPQQNLVDRKSPRELRAHLRFVFLARLQSEEVQRFAKGAGDWKAWFWCAPLLLDKVAPGNDIAGQWIAKGLPSSESVTDSEDLSAQKAEATGKSRYFQRISDFFNAPASVPLPRLTERQLGEVADFMVMLALGSPAVCYLRTQQRAQSKITSEMMDGAFEVASGFVTMFNKPESVAVVRLNTDSRTGGSHLDRVLEYSIGGNLQALLDEYFYLIQEQEGLHTPAEVASHISDVLTIRSTTAKVDDASSILKAAMPNSKGRARSMRTHFAVDFSGKNLMTGKSSGRLINIRQAFNSPFRPFVLATTSIGQEGLDFHLYCRKIFHWNLPANAIDIEQREGRINRYKGLVIRQNLVRKYCGSLKLSGAGDAWDELFSIAEDKEGKGQGTCELIPFWHTEPQEGIRIERYVPLYSFSRDIEKYRGLQKILAYYRITFGQPRQEELIMALADKVGKQGYEAIRELLVDLSPIRFRHA